MWRTWFCRWQKRRGENSEILSFTPVPRAAGSHCCERHHQWGVVPPLWWAASSFAGKQPAPNCPSVKFLWSQIIWDAFPLNTRWLLAKFFNLRHLQLDGCQWLWGESHCDSISTSAVCAQSTSVVSTSFKEKNIKCWQLDLVYFTGTAKCWTWLIASIDNDNLLAPSFWRLTPRSKLHV